MKFIDLFCGIGGFHQALKNIGCECVFASDIDKDCRDIYEENYGIKPVGDIVNIDITQIPEFDILCGGFPCQPFSKAGFQKGFDDERGNLFYTICKIIEYHKPKYIILENVRNLASHDSGNTWKTIYKLLNELNYNTYENPVILNTLYFGVPQSRERVVILCKRRDIGELPSLPSLSKINNKETSIESIIEREGVDEKYKIKGRLKVAEEVWDNFLKLLEENNISVPKFPIWTDWWDSDGKDTLIYKKNSKKTDEENNRDIENRKKDFYMKYKNWIDKNRDFYKKYKSILQPWLETSRKRVEWKGAVRKMEWQTGTKNGRMNSVLWSPRGSGIRIKSLDYTPTLVAMTSMIPIYGPLSRELTPRECARLQSFPDTFILHSNDNTSYKQFGNAVNVIMIQRSADFLINNKKLLLC